MHDTMNDICTRFPLFPPTPNVIAVNRHRAVAIKYNVFSSFICSKYTFSFETNCP